MSTAYQKDAIGRCRFPAKVIIKLILLHCSEDLVPSTLQMLLTYIIFIKIIIQLLPSSALIKSQIISFLQMQAWKLLLNFALKKTTARTLTYKPHAFIKTSLSSIRLGPGSLKYLFSSTSQPQ